LGKNVRLNRPGKKHNSGFSLPPITVTKLNKKDGGVTKENEVGHFFLTPDRLEPYKGLGVELQCVTGTSL